MKHPRLETYKLLVKAVKTIETIDDNVMDQLLDVMDTLWWEFSNEEMILYTKESKDD